MTGVYLELVEEDKLPIRLIGSELCFPGLAAVERFCDRDGEYQRKYNVYRLTGEDGRQYVLKKSDFQEIAVQERFLQDSGFPVPPYYGHVQAEDGLWMLTGYIEGRDLRCFSRELATASAESLCEIQNAYWDCGEIDGRFQRYWERVNRRAQCLEREPELKAAYHIFLARQREMPLTLSSGDFLPLNGIFSEGRVYILDWGFGGALPYALDIARLIAHGVQRPGPGTFPFRMEEEHGRAFVRLMYEGLTHKPPWERYVQDIRLAALNEYIEFLEEDLTGPDTDRRELEESFYYRRARQAAKEVLQNAKQ